MDAALELGFGCGGWCPRGRLAEDGRIPEHYPLTELPDGGYAVRTARNVADSDGTLIIANGPPIGGTRETVERCIETQKPYLMIDAQSASIETAIEQAVEFVLSLSHSGLGITTVLNVAGPRASQWPNGRAIAREIVVALLQRLSGHRGSDVYSA